MGLLGSPDEIAFGLLVKEAPLQFSLSQAQIQFKLGASGVADILMNQPFWRNVLICTSDKVDTFEGAPERKT